MSIEEVATFVEAALAGSMAGGSRALGVPTSTVSRRIHRLEEELGVQLVESHARMFRLTEAGDALLKRSASAVRDLREALHGIRDGSDAVRGQLRITAPQDLGCSSAMAQLLSDFRAAHSGIEVMLDIADRRVDLMADGVDFAFRVHAGDLQARPSLMARRLIRLDGGLFASPRYLQQAGEPGDIEDLFTGDHRLISPLVGIPLTLFRGDAERVLAGIPSPLQSTSMSFMLPAALVDLGIAPIPELIAMPSVEDGRLVRVLPEWSLQRASLSLLWPSSRLPSPRRRSFLDFVVDHTRSWSPSTPTS